ncbi:MAG TPA: nitrite reductase small subunit NirD [Rhizobacter sp.]|jgi:nitrite reductase (NADH) small subunit|nr:nitrite reductase small subunit NirD [Rhizobacter sp.]
MPHWTLICRVEDIIPLGSRRVTRPRGAAVAVFRAQGDSIFAVLDRCPHKGGPLSQGIVFGHSVACPLHNMNIGLDDGQVKAPDEGCVPKFAVKLEDGAIYLDSDELATLGVDLPMPVAGPCATRGAVGGGQVFDVQTPHSA